MTRPFIMVAPSGARRTKADHAALPITVSEIVAEAIACAKAGADALHLHVRDADGGHSLDEGFYVEAIAALHDALPNLRIQITTESAGRYAVPEQLKCLEKLAPKWASVSVREIARAPKLARQLYHGCAELDTELQHILYDTDDLAQLKIWQYDGTIPRGTTSVIFVLGRYAPQHDAMPADLDAFLEHLDPQME